MAPVRRTLVPTWRGEGSSVVAKMEGDDSGSSMGPPSSGGVMGAVVVAGSGSWASHRSGLGRGSAEKENRGGFVEKVRVKEGLWWWRERGKTEEKVVVMAMQHLMEELKF
ncbi:hypothetical protein GH714_010146 [Hevea brasiliensis]|uniref:Uncharacterized protein n=1 Tax=Hevea brasiliensis TaxID=3981 RepID=A0A6A6KDS3_HEVBR|nr:hypothetical protein GH714_010146 [Hevea brasiliensis]